MLDVDSAELYGVAVKRLNEQVRRNGKRFPSDFMFQLTPEEYEALRSQFAALVMKIRRALREALDTGVGDLKGRGIPPSKDYINDTYMAEGPVSRRGSSDTLRVCTSKIVRS